MLTGEENILGFIFVAQYTHGSTSGLRIWPLNLIHLSHADVILVRSSLARYGPTGLQTEISNIPEARLVRDFFEGFEVTLVVTVRLIVLVVVHVTVIIVIVVDVAVLTCSRLGGSAGFYE